METEKINRSPKSSKGWSAYLLTVLLLYAVSIWSMIYRPWIETSLKPFIYPDELAYQIFCIGYLAALIGSPLIFIAGRLKFLNEKQNQIPGHARWSIAAALLPGLVIWTVVLGMILVGYINRAGVINR